MKQTMDLRGALQMTPRLIDAIQLLQLSSLDLAEYVQAQVESNPLLTLRDKPFKQPLKNSLEWDQISQLKAPLSLKDQIEYQLPHVLDKSSDTIIAYQLMQHLTSEGYFDGDIFHISKQLKVPPERVESVLKRLQKCEPAGIFARSLIESLKIQLGERLTPQIEQFLLSMEILPNLGLQKYAKEIDLPLEDCKDILELLKTLKPRPLESTIDTIVRVPDIIVSYSGNSKNPYLVELNQDVLPDVFLETSYYQMLKTACKKQEDLKYVEDQKKQADWLLNALAKRSLNTLLIAKEIIEQQKDFFEKGISALKPLCLQDIAKNVGVHESTVSRITTDRTMETPLGLFDFKFFFSSKLKAVTRSNLSAQSSKSVMDKIKMLIKSEVAPLSDEDISALLKGEGVEVARRTVAKYRGIMGIEGSSKRGFKKF